MKRNGECEEKVGNAISKDEKTENLSLSKREETSATALSE